MAEDFMLFAIRAKNTIKKFGNLIESNKILELDEEELENKLLVITTLNNNEQYLTEEEKDETKKDEVVKYRVGKTKNFL